MYIVEDFEKYKSAVVLRAKLENVEEIYRYYLENLFTICLISGEYFYNKVINIVCKYYKPHLPRLTVEMLKKIFPYYDLWSNTTHTDTWINTAPTRKIYSSKYNSTPIGWYSDTISFDEVTLVDSI